MNETNSDSAVKNQFLQTDAPVRWVRYISVDRRVLWTEYPDEQKSPPYKKDVPDAPEWKNSIDAAFATRLPQRNAKRLVHNGKPESFTLKIFPDFGAGGDFKGVIQVVELRESREGKNDTVVIAAENREVHSVLDLTLSGIVLYRPECDVIQNVNHRFAQETGFAVSELEGMPGRILFGDDGVNLIKNIHQRMLNAGDGVVCGQVLGIHDRRGRVEHHYCSLLLIPARPDNHADRVLYISLNSQECDRNGCAVDSGPSPRFILEAFQECFWEYDHQKKLFRYGRSFEDVFGPDGVPGGPGMDAGEWIASLYPSDRDQIVQNWHQLLKKGERYRTFYRTRDPGGNWRWMISTIHAILNDARGRPARVIGLHLEITEAMRSEQNLSDAEERLRVVFDNSGVGIALADIDGGIQRANRALALMLGRDPDDFEERQMSEFAHPEAREQVAASRKRLVKGGRREALRDVPFLKPDGSTVWMDLTLTLSRRVTCGARYIVITAEDVTSAHLSREKLLYEATHDVMTGAWSRWVLFERLEQHLHLAVRHRQAMTYCLCDLDHFKMINDVHGHLAGDRVLVRFVEILKSELRDTDIIGRYGGEEFGIVLPNTSVAGALGLLERVRGKLGGEVFRDGNGAAFHVSVTIGVAGAWEGAGTREVLALADEALYQGKEEGRDRVVVGKEPASGWL